MLKIFAAFIALAGVTLVAVAWADEEKVAIDKLPAKVKDAVTGKFPDAKLISASKEPEDGKVLFEVTIENKSKTVQVTVTEDGNIVEVESEMDAKDLPKTVTESLDKKYGKLKFLKAEDVVKGEKTYFEVLIEHADGKKKTEVQIDKDGKILNEEDKTKEKE